MRAVNLLPRAEPTRRLRLSPPLATAVMTSLVVATVLASGYLLESAKVTRERNALDAARVELSLAPKPTPAPPAVEQRLPAEQTARVAALQGALDGRVAWDRVLRDLALVLPRDVWLNHLALTSPSHAATQDATTATQPFEMAGNAFSHEGVARLLSRLQVLPELTNVTLDHSRAITPGKHGAQVEFKILAQIRAPEGAAS